MSADKKEIIMNAAIELFAEKGFEGTSIRDLATRADVNVAMVNYYFGSKDKLFEALIEQKATFMRGRLDEIASNKKLSEIEKRHILFVLEVCEGNKKLAAEKLAIRLFHSVGLAALSGLALRSPAFAHLDRNKQ